jgi:hypothetical protein
MFIGGTFYLIMPFSKQGKATILGAASCTDGSSIVLSQTYGGLERLYDVFLDVRSNDKLRKGYYIEHDSLYWRNSRVVIDSLKGKAFVWRGKTLIAVYNCKSKVFFHVALRDY